MGKGVIGPKGDIQTMALNEWKNLCCKNIIDVSLGIDVSINNN